MANGEAPKESPFKLPSFPVQFSDIDKARVTELDEKRKELENIYLGHYTPEAWGAKPLIERGARRVAESVIPFDKTFRDITPWEEQGFTPQQFDEYRGEIESEYQGLLRNQLVLDRVSHIKEHLLALALGGKLTGSIEQLYDLIPELKSPGDLPLRDVEREWIETYATSLAGKSRDEILDIYDTSGGELSPEEVMENIKLVSPNERIDPRFLSATVSFSKDLEEVTSALQEAYPPEVEEVDVSPEDKAANSIWEEMKERGLVPSGDLEADVKVLEKDYAKELEEKGIPDFLETKDESGKVIASGKVRIFPNGDVFSESELGLEKVGTYNADTKEFAPLPEGEQLEAVDQVPFIAIREDGKEVELIYKFSDSTVWEGKTLIGSISEDGDFTPKDPEWYETALAYTLKGLEYTRFPFSFFGMKMQETVESFKAMPEAILSLPEVFKEGEMTPELSAWLDKTLSSGLYGHIVQQFLDPENLSEEEKKVLEPFLTSSKMSEYGMGGDIYQKYMELPWWQQLLYELPLYATMGAVGLSATSARASLAPLTARGGMLGTGAQATRVALAPVAGYEWLAGKAFYYAFGVPIAKIASTASNKYFQAMWSKSFPSHIFKAGTPEYNDMFRIWKLYHTKPPAGQPADVYEQAARQAFQNQINTNIEFKTGILSWLKDMSSKGAASEEAMSIIPMLANATSSSTGASSSTQTIISNIVKQATEKNIPSAAITATFISNLVPEGIVLGKPNSLVEQLSELGYTGKMIADFSPEEAWSISLGNREPVVQSGSISPEVMEEVKTIDAKLGRIKDELAVYQHSYNVSDARVQKMEASKDILFIDELKETVSGLKSRIDKLTEQQVALGKERAALQGQVDTAKEKMGTLPIEQPPKLILEEMWNGMSIPARVATAKAVGLEGGVGSKAWTSLTAEEKSLITKQAKLVEESVFQEEGVSESLASKWKARKQNALSLRKDLEKLEKGGEDVEAAYDALVDYGLVVRSDYKNIGDYKGAREEAWSKVIKVLDSLGVSEVVTPVVPEGIISSSGADAIELNKSLPIDEAKATQQAETMESYPEGVIDANEIAGREPEGVPQSLEDYLLEADTSNPLDVAAVKAIYSGDVHDYAEALPPDFSENVSQAFKDAEFYDASYQNLMRMDTYRAFAFIDNGRFGGMLRTKVLSPAEHLHKAKLNKLEHYTSWYIGAEHRYHMNSYHFRSEEGKELCCKAIETIKDFGDTIKSTEEILARPEVQELVGNYPIDVQENIVSYAQEVRILYEAVRAETNVVRVKLNKEPIEHLDNYLPWIYKANVWGKLFGLRMKPETFKQSGFIPDYIRASEPPNYRALAREGGLAHYDKIRDPRKLMLDYFDVMTNDMFFTPIIQNTKAHMAAIREKVPAAADWVADWAVEAYAGTPGAVSKAARKILPPFVRNTLLTMRRNLTRAVFPLNWTWNLFVQTSSISLTVLQQGLGYTIKGTQFLWNKDSQDAVGKMFSYIIKQRLEGSLIYQDLGALVQKEHSLTRSKLDTVTHHANLLTRLIEKNVTGMSCCAGYLKAKDMGYSEREALDYGSEAGAKSQSRYDIAGVPGTLRSSEVGAILPFQTFAFEAFNSIGEISAFKYLKSGAWRTAGADTKDGREMKSVRLKKFLAFFAALWAFNTVGDICINRKPWQPSSFIPFTSLMMSGIEPNKSWNYPFPIRYVSEFVNASKVYYTYEDWKPLVSWFVKYHTPGGIQINRVMGGIIAVIDGDVKNVAGDTLYEIDDDPVEWLRAITMGTYLTEGGREYRDRMDGVEPTTDSYLKDINEVEEQLGEEVDGKYYMLPHYGRAVDNMLVDWEKKQETLIEEESMEWTGLPEYIITAEGSPFPPLAQFRVYSNRLLKEYDNLPGGDRIDYRKTTPAVDAVLFFWYETSTVRSEEAKDIVQGLFEYYGVMETPYMHPSQLPEVPEELKLIPE